MTVPSLSVDRPECLSCSHLAPRGELICPACRTRLAELLDTIRREYPLLDPAPDGAGHDGGRPPVGFGSRPPLRIAVLALLAAPASARTSRSLAGSDGADLVRGARDPDKMGNAHVEPLLVTAGRWADRAREDDVLSPLAGVRTVIGECLRLTGQLDALADRWWVGDMIRDLARAAHHVALARGTFVPHTARVGACPRIRDDARALHERTVADLGEHLAEQIAQGEDWHCGGVVRGRLTAEAATCTRCHHTWRGEGVLRALGEQLGGAMLDLSAMVRHLDGTTVPVLRQWAHRDGWPRERVGRRTIYDLSAARASWWARRGPQLVGVDEAGRIGA